MEKINVQKRTSVLDQLDSNGYCFVKDQNRFQVDSIISELGHVINQTEVVANVGSQSLVTSDKFLDFHTDNHLAKYILWYCLEPAESGGISMLCDADLIYEKLDDVEKLELSKIHVYEHKMFPENRNSNPIVRNVNGMRRFYYSFWLSREKYRELPAFKRWQELIKNSPHVRLKLEKNDILVIDNHRFLHGRTEIKGERKLLRYWLNPDFYPTKELYKQD